MPRTIVQEYGPIYGEPVNGTVLGRPNGSVFVPLSNTASIELAEDYRYVRYARGAGWQNLRFCNSAGVASDTPNRPKYVAVAQDLASNMLISVYSDDELNTLVAQRSVAAGTFNVHLADIQEAVDGLTDGQTLYLIMELVNNGTPVATSDVIEITMVVPA